MLTIQKLLSAFVITFCVGVPARAQVGGVPCIDTCTGALRTLTSNPGAYIYAAGYYASGQGGGGSFYTIPTGPACTTLTQSASWQTSNPYVITYTGSTPVTAGMAIVTGQANLGLPAYDVVTSVGGGQITLRAPVTASGSGTVSFSLDNGGSVVRDGETSPVCYYRAQFEGNPREWGAHGDGVSDDTAPMQNWLTANQLHTGDVGTYMVSSPLKCAANTTIQAPSNVNSATPLFAIEAFGPSSTTPFSGILSQVNTQGVIAAYNFCRISGTAIIASQPISVQGTTNHSATICLNSAVPAGVDVGNYVTAPVTNDIPGNTTVVSFMGACSHPVTISNSATGSNMNETINFSSPISLAGTTTTGSKTISGLSTVAGIQIGNAVTDADAYVPANSVVSTITSSPCCSVVFTNPTNTGAGNGANEPITFWGPDGVDVIGGHVTIDGFSNVSGGRYNVDCGDNSLQGELQVKDSMVQLSTSDSVYLPNCVNVRLIGDHVSSAGQNVGFGSSARGVVFEGEDLTVADGVIDDSEGVGLYMAGVNAVSVTGMNISSNGTGTAGGQGIDIRNGNTVSVCGNHFKGNDSGDITSGASAHVYFEGASSGINFCGNTYLIGGANNPNYVYNASGSATFQSAGFYENPSAQGVGVLSANAAAILPQTQVTPGTRSFLTGLVLSNDQGAINSKVDITAGAATDSTGNFVIQNPNGCNVDLSMSGLNGLDTGTFTANKTYFFFVVADSTLPVGTTSPSCIGSAGLVPSIASYVKPVYRLVGALYTETNTPINLVLFKEVGDTFYLAVPGNDINVTNLGNSDTTYTVGSVPSGIAVEWLGRCVGGQRKSHCLQPQANSGDTS